MKINNKMYGQEYDPNVLKDLSEINKKLNDAESQEELLKLRMLRLYRGMDLNTANTTRGFRGYYPY